MNPNSTLSDDEQNIDYDAIYGGIDADESDYNRPKSLSKAFGRIVKDVAIQGAKETAIGGLGTYGDILNLVGLNSPQMNPGENSSYNIESDILDKLNQGQAPSASELAFLSNPEDPLPRYSNLPTSQDVRSLNDMLGGPGEAETTPGRYAGRIGRIYGSTAPFGGFNPIPAAAAGTVGQTVEELGGGPLSQIASEIVTLIATQGKGGASVANNKAAQDKIRRLKDLGYSDQDITLAINAAKSPTGAKTLKTKIAKPTAASEAAFEGASKRSEELFQGVLNKAFPGLEEGIPSMEKAASEVYGKVAENAKNLPIKDASKLNSTIEEVMADVENTLANTPDEKTFVNFLKEATDKLKNNSSADTFINFYQRLNKMGRWIDPSKKEILLTKVKDSLKETFRRQGPQGEKLASEFETANKAWQRLSQAEEVSSMLASSFTEEGANFQKLYNTVQKPKNYKQLEKSVGKESASKLKQIAKTGKDISNFQKKFGSLSKSGWLAGAKASQLIGALVTQNWGLVASTLGTEVASRLATRMLTDPKFQDLTLRTLHAVKNSSPRVLSDAGNRMKKYLDDQGIDADLD